MKYRTKEISKILFEQWTWRDKNYQKDLSELSGDEQDKDTLPNLAGGGGHKDLLFNYLKYVGGCIDALDPGSDV